MVCLLDDPNRNARPTQTSDKAKAAAISAHNQSTGLRRGLLSFYSLRNRVVLQKSPRPYFKVISRCCESMRGRQTWSRQRISSGVQSFAPLERQGSAGRGLKTRTLPLEPDIHQHGVCLSATSEKETGTAQDPGGS